MEWCSDNVFLLNETSSELYGFRCYSNNVTAQSASDAEIAAGNSNSGVQLHDVQGGTVNINVSYGSMRFSGANEQK